MQWWAADGLLCHGGEQISASCTCVLADPSGPVSVRTVLSMYTLYYTTLYYVHYIHSIIVFCGGREGRRGKGKLRLQRTIQYVGIPAMITLG